MKKAVIILLMISMIPMLSADEMTVEEWNQLNAELTEYLADYAERVYRGEALPMKSGTPLIRHLYFSRPEGATASVLNDNRHDTMSYTYGTDNFLLHYTNQGIHAVYQFDQQTIEPGYPDYIVAAAQSLEYVFEHQTGDTNFGHLGFDPPISDGYYNGGGDGRFDVYFAQLPYYGGTYVDSTQPTLPLTATTYLMLENDYVGFPGYEGTRNILALQVTAAHEFFHSVQFAIDLGESEVWGSSMSDAWIEMSAVFMEEEHYTNVNDYYNYLLFFYAVPQWSLRTGYRIPITSLQTWMNLHMYGAGVWPIFLKEKFGVEIIREIWTRCGDVAGFNWVTATDDAIKSLSADSLDLREMYRRFALWNLFTGTWARSGEYFPEAEDYIRITFAAQVDDYPAIIRADTSLSGVGYTLVSDSARPDNRGTDYILLTNLTSMTSGLAISLDLDESQPWAVNVVGLPEDVSDIGQTVWIDPVTYDSASTSILISNASDFHKVVLILSVVDGNQLENDYSLNITPLGEGLYNPSGGEVIYAGTLFPITWFFADSVINVELELSTDNGISWTSIETTENDFIYEWTVPNTPSDNCLIAICNADNSSQCDTSDAVFTIRSVATDRVLDPYPNPAWIQRDQYITFRVEQATGASDGLEAVVTILNLAGEKVKEFPPRPTEIGSAVFEWDFKNQEGQIVAAGAYMAVIEFGDQTEVKKFVVLR